MTPTWRTLAFAFVTAAVLLLMGACLVTPYSAQPDERFFYLRRGNALLPVWVRGNSESDAIVIVLHGGPGDTSNVYRLNDTFGPLEEDYTFVYWDQRGSGMSQGREKRETLTAEESARDLDALVQVMKTRRPEAAIFLHGHSWGGLLGTQYLGNPRRQARVDGWIEVNGGHDWPAGMELSVQWITDYAEEQVQSPDVSDADKQFWQDALVWYRENPLDGETATAINWILTHTGKYVDRAYGYFTEANYDRIMEELGGDLEQNLHSMFTFNGQWAWFADRDVPVWEANDTSRFLDDITLPTLIAWGRHDGILPAPQGQDAYDRIATPAEDKTLVYFENSAHSPMFEEPDAFFNAVRAFIEEYR